MSGHVKIPGIKLKEKGESRLHFPLLAIWLGLVTGFMEVAVWAVQKAFFDPFGYLGRDVIWMAPLTDSIVLLIPGVVLALLARSAPARDIRPYGTFFLVFLAISSLLFLSYKLHPLAAVPLAIGVAYQSSRFIGLRRAAFEEFIRRSLGGLLVLLLSCIGGARGLQLYGEVTTLGKLPVSRAKTPNVLLIVLDTVRAESMSLYGYQRRTSPHLEELAKKGTLFRTALATSPWTLPSHSSIFTGRYPHELSSGWYSPLDEKYPTLAEVLSENGYINAGFVANSPYCSYETGLDRGFSHFEDYSLSPGEFLRSSSLIRRSLLQFFDLRRLTGIYDLPGRKNASDINQAFLNWLDAGSERPFFAFLNYFDAHDPYLPAPLSKKPDSWTREEYLLVCNWWFMEKKDLTLEQIQVVKRAYESCIAYLDSQIGRLLEQLRSRGILDNTILVITSDHGELFGEHGLYGHGNCLFRPVLQVPLMIVFPPKVPAGGEVTDPVSLREIPATILDLIGPGKPHSIPGASLARYWAASGENEVKEGPILSEIAEPCRIPPDHGRSPVAAGKMQAILQDGMMYIKNHGDGTEQLYDFEHDPMEQRNLLHERGEEWKLQALRKSLERFTPAASQAE